MNNYYYEDRRRSQGEDYNGSAAEYYNQQPRYEDYQRSSQEFVSESPNRDLVRRQRSNSRDMSYYNPSNISEYAQEQDYNHHGRHRSHSPSHTRGIDQDQHHQRHHHAEHDRSFQPPAEHHHKAKNAAATVLGGIAGEQIGKHMSHGGRLAEVAGVVIGAWGGHELEKGWESHEEREREKRRFEGGR